MTHFGVLVLVDQIDKAIANAHKAVTPEVTRLLAPYDENDEAFREGSKWDWWVIGGRWTGSLDGYDPTKDPTNVVTCDLCHGTGTRPDGLAKFGAAWVEAMHGCNGCNGTGKMVTWPSQWGDHKGDIAPAASIDAAKIADSFAAVVTPDGAWHGARMGWWGAVLEEKADSAEAWVTEVKSLLDAHPTATAVVVDCHV